MGRAAAKKPSANGADAHVPTVRELLPWHVLEKKMGERAGGKQGKEERNDEVDVSDVQLVEDTPDSGVYTSGQHPAANEIFGDVPQGDGLTYKVYTVSELEKRGIAADLSMSSTRMSVAILAAKQTPWEDAAYSALAVLRMAKTWLSSPSPRPPVKEVLHAPYAAFTFELRTALRTVQWRKVGAYCGIAFASLAVLLFIVVTAAELTDDLKPARTVTTTTGDAYTSAIVAAAHPTVAKPKAAPAPAPIAPAPVAHPAAVDDLDISDEPAAAPVRTAKSRPASKGAPKKKAPHSEVFIP